MNLYSAQSGSVYSGFSSHVLEKTSRKVLIINVT